MLRLIRTLSLLAVGLAIAGCYKSPSYWDTSPDHVLLRITPVPADTKLDAWFATPEFVLYGDGTIIQPHARAGKLAWAQITAEQTDSLLKYMKEDCKFQEMEEAETPTEPGLSETAPHGLYEMELGLPEATKTSWYDGRVTGGLTSLTDEYQPLLLSLPWEIYEPPGIRYAVGELTSPTGDEYSGPLVVPPDPQDWPLTGPVTLADRADLTQTHIALGHRDGEWIEIPQATGTFADTIVSAADNDFEFPLVFREGDKLYWVRWAPVIQNPKATPPKPG
jgi:hypothetical protein